MSTVAPFELLFGALFTLWGQPVTGLELAAFVTGLASVWLTWRLHIANWPCGLVSVACFALLFVQARLYADALLQVAFFIFGLYGWYAWASGAPAGAQPVRVTRAPVRERIIVVGVASAATLAVAAGLRQYTDSPAPFADAAVFAFSLAAIYTQARVRLENWWLWIAVDLISIPLYWTRQLPLTALLYMLFLLICLRGLRAWRLRAEPAA